MRDITDLSRALLDAARKVAGDQAAAKRSRAYSARSINANAEAYEGLTDTSLALAGLKQEEALGRRLNVLLPRLRPDSMFAGTKTAVDVALKLGDALGSPVRLVVINSRLSRRQAVAVRRRLTDWHGPLVADVAIVDIADLRSVGLADLWVATHWSTAHALDVAARTGIINASAVCYLIQDYEPVFLPFSTAHALCRATYHAGFLHLVNSAPVASSIATTEGLDEDRFVTFRPAVPLDALREVLSHREIPVVPRVLFYARPSKPRNMYALGAASLRLASVRSRGVRWEAVSAGEAHPRLLLRNHGVVRQHGRKNWADYLRLLASSNIVLSLQNSPHPSHPPLDAVFSGAQAVTNDFHGQRGSLHPLLRACEPDPDAIASGLLTGIDQAFDRLSKDVCIDRGDALLTSLGRPLDEALTTVAEVLSRR